MTTMTNGAAVAPFALGTIIVTKRKNKRGQDVPLHVWRSTDRKMKRNLAGTDPHSLAYRQSHAKAIADYQRLTGNGEIALRKRYKRNDKGQPIDDHGNVIKVALKPTLAEAAAHPPALEESVGWLVERFQASDQFLSCSAKTQRSYRDLFVDALAQVVSDDIGTGPLADFRYTSVKKPMALKLRQRYAKTPGKADDLVSKFRSLFYWGEDQGLFNAANPFARMGKLRNNVTGVKMWSHYEVEKVRNHYPVGTRPRLAIELAIYNGSRVSCLWQLGPQHETEPGFLSWTESKGKGSTAMKGNVRQKNRRWPIDAELARVIAATPHGDFAYITQANGQPYASEDCLKKALEKWVVNSGLKVKRSFHGLRKYGAVRLYRKSKDLLAVRDFLGHTTVKETQVYIEQADKELRAMEAVHGNVTPLPRRAA
jgi:integrase